jgi:hypothetical protein
VRVDIHLGIGNNDPDLISQQHPDSRPAVLHARIVDKKKVVAKESLIRFGTS